MKEKIIKILAAFFRTIPHFKGKYRIGKIIQNNFISDTQWKNPEVFIKLKNKAELYIDVRSGTHKVPFWTGMRDDKIINLIKKNIQPNSVVFDVGANIGYYSIPLALHLKKHGGEVHAFEPVDSNFKSLGMAIKQNKLTNVISNKFALGASEGNIEIVKTEKGNSGNAVLSFNDSDYEKGMEKEIIPMTTLDLYMTKSQLLRCDFIKIDIEGAEIFFIQGGLNFIEKYQPIIYGEFNSYFLKKFGYTVLDIWELIEPLGYTCYIEDKYYRGSFNKTTIREGNEDLLLIPKKNEGISNWLKN